MNRRQMLAGRLPPVIPGIARGIGYPTQTAVTYLGVYPTNHASLKSFVVPVLPATGTFGRFAAVPVPPRTFARRMLVTSAATPSEITFVSFGLKTVALPVGRTSLVIGSSLRRKPPLASGAYARAMSSTLTPR